MPDSPNCRRLAGRLAAVLIGVVVFSAFLAVVLARGLADGDGLAAELVRDRGPHKLMRRLMMVLAIPFIPGLLRAAGWRGWRDTGQSADPQRRVDPAWLVDLALGAGIGAASLGVLGGLAVAFGARAWAPGSSAGAGVAILAGTAVSAMVIGWFEETAVRGILFRTLARAWSLVPAMLVSSLLFSALHFLKASRGAFGEGPVWVQTGEVLWSALTNPARTSAFVPRFLNLTLMGVVLCLFVHRTRTIWVAAGTHAAWVWVRQANELLTAAVPGAAGPWVGRRSDCTDSLVTVLMFVVLAWLGSRYLPVRGRRGETS